MPTGFSMPARRWRGTRWTAPAAALATALTLGAVAPSTAATEQGAPTSNPTSTYPAPGQPVSTPAPSEAEATTTVDKDEQDLRVATLHADLVTESQAIDAADQLVSALRTGNHVKSRAIARTVQMNRPDVLVLTGVTYDSGEQIAEQLRSSYLSLGQD